MNPRSRRTRVRTRLVAVVLVPLVAVGVLASVLVRDRVDRAARARGTQAALETFLLTEQLDLRLRVERDLAVLLARGRAHGTDEPTMSSIFGVDVVPAYERARRGTSQLLDQLRTADLGSRAGSASGLRADTLALVAVSRPPVGEWTGSEEALANVYAVGLNAARAASDSQLSAVEGALAELGDARELADLLSAIEHIDELHRAVVDELNELAMIALPVDGQTSDERTRRALQGQQRTLVSQLDAMLPPAEAELWRHLTASEPFTAFDTLRRLLVDDATPAASAAAGNSLTASSLVGLSLERSELLVGFAMRLGKQLSQMMAAIEVDAANTANAIIAATAVLAVGTLVAGAFAVRWITHPLQRVLVQARRVTEGDLEPTPSRSLDRGPREVVELAGAVDVLGHNLAAIDAYARALAEGRLEDARLGVTLPGGIGRLLEVTMDRLSGETARLAHQARHDPLTGLMNRGAILAALADSLREPRRAGQSPGAVVAFVDLDAFKAVNDCYGHAVGDELLSEVAHRMTMVARTDHHVGRLGGDEFVVIVRAPDEAPAVAKDLLACFDRPFRVSVGELSLKASIGLVRCDGASDPTDALRRADEAAYEAKRAGKARLVMAS